MGILKAYNTRVGEGPFPTEFDENYADQVRDWGKEFGATTGRPRRCGWFDAVLAGYSARINGLTELTITKLDVLDRFETLKICTGYIMNGKPVNDHLADLETMQKAKPQYEDMPGWKSKTSDIREFNKLPVEAQNYVKRIEELVNVPVAIISVGSERDQTIFCS